MPTLFLAVSYPNDDIGEEDVDPDQAADELVAMLNEVRRYNGCPPDQMLMVSALPAPQWLTRESLASLHRAATYGQQAGEADDAR